MLNATVTASLSFTGMSYFLSITTPRIADTTIVYRPGVWIISGRQSIGGAYSVQIDSRLAESFPVSLQGVIQSPVVLCGANGLRFGERLWFNGRAPASARH